MSIFLSFPADRAATTKLPGVSSTVLENAAAQPAAQRAETHAHTFDYEIPTICRLDRLQDALYTSMRPRHQFCRFLLVTEGFAGVLRNTPKRGNARD
jgi:hypothetical protein